MSKIADDVYETIKKLFPHEVIIPEYYVNYKNTRLFFDFFMKNLGVLIECQGEQHYRFIKHFHGFAKNFYNQKNRDNLKIEWCEKNNLTLVYFYDRQDSITNDLILRRLYEAFDE